MYDGARVKDVRIIAIITLACLAGGAGGCGAGGFWEKIGFKRKPSPQEQVEMVYASKDPDVRREGIALLSSNSWGLKEIYLKKYAEILRTDKDASVRGVAVRALGRSGNNKFLDDVVAAMSDESDSVRWDAAVALDRLVGPAAVGPLRICAVRDPSADVRAACARALRNYPEEPVRRTLAACLRDKAFAVRYQAHASLVRITGRDMGYEPENWSGVAGAKAPTTRPAYAPKRPWWDWAGITDKHEEPEGKPEDKPEKASPWWDWLGATENKPAGER